MDAITNSFCAVCPLTPHPFTACGCTEFTPVSQGGNVLGNGTWLNVGGNEGITYGGVKAASQAGGGPYDDPDGGKSCVSMNSYLYQNSHYPCRNLAFGELAISRHYTYMLTRCSVY